ncbi:aquaporin-4-like isoform X1 [Rhineura floridana]|uniref:aquaporin-4-like isoform X1 n=1 Tax=Rhineura floridana TaxID=261503 RepID=UPI002AC86A2B|nr:aquaporin-4-like isoform X1 [Rhineura floridana]XP_061471183.1 aquaporin-4-like isoform X1 [Rhineura floridana]
MPCVIIGFPPKCLKLIKNQPGIFLTFKLQYMKVRVWGKELQSRHFWCCLLAEAAGTLIFVWVVLGASSPAGPKEVLPSPLQPALAAGLVAVSLAHCFGEISGAQVNPALTVAFLCTRKLDALHAASYILAQCLGAILASEVFYLVLPTSAIGQLVTQVSNEGNAGQALGMEAFSTFQLALTIFAVEDHRKRESGEPGILAIGFSVIAGALAAGTFSGGSMNPARSLGPAVVTGIWEHHWVYWLGPVLGAVLAGISYEFFFANNASREKLVACLTCRDIEIVEAASVSRSSLSAPTKPPCKGEHSTE